MQFAELDFAKDYTYADYLNLYYPWMRFSMEFKPSLMATESRT